MSIPMSQSRAHANGRLVANCVICYPVSLLEVSRTHGCSLSLSSFIVTLGWILGKPLTLLFDPYESIVLFLAGAYQI
jgi:hypothetical protein